MPKDYVIPPEPEPTVSAAHLIEVSSVNLHASLNRTAHHTDRYEAEGLVLRRGQRFAVSVVTTKAVPASAKVACRAAFTPVLERHRRDMFDVATLCSIHENKLDIAITIPVDIAIGR